MSELIWQDTIRQTITDNSITLAEFARRVGVQYMTAWRWKMGRSTPLQKSQEKILALLAKNNLTSE